MAMAASALFRLGQSLVSLPTGLPMDFFKGLFGMKPGEGDGGGGAKKAPAGSPKKMAFPSHVVGPSTHPKLAHIAFAATFLQASPLNNNLPSVYLILWDYGRASTFHYDATKQGDSTPEKLYKAFMSGSSWTPSTNSPVTSISLTVKPASAASSSAAKPSAHQSPTTADKTLDLKFRPVGSNDVFSTPNHPLINFKELTNAYLDRLNKLLITVEKQLRETGMYSERLHMSMYACLVEAERLIFHIFHDLTLDSAQKQTRFKLLNEWITRMLLALDGMTVPMIPVPKSADPAASPDATNAATEEDQEYEPDPEIRAKRKSLVNLSLALGAELAALASSKSPSDGSIASSSQGDASNPTAPQVTEESAESRLALLSAAWASLNVKAKLHPLFSAAEPKPSTHTPSSAPKPPTSL